MAAITQETMVGWKALASQLSLNNPLNKRVKVVGGRKHKGKIGKVISQMRDQYYDWKYVDQAQEMYRTLEGRDGFVGLVMDEQTNSTFWVKCTYLEILN